MNFALFSVTRPVAVTMRIAALVLLGAICLTRLPIDLLPKVTVPTVVVATQWPNVGPEQIEAQVTRPIEQAVSTAPNMYQVTSSTVEGGSNVRIQFRWGTDIGQAAVDVLQLVQRARQRFPVDQTLQVPIVYKLDPSTLPILIFGISGEPDPVKLRNLLDNQVSPIIESADGVAAAQLTGGIQRAIIINVNPDKLRAYNIPLSTVSKRIAQENLNLPAGIAKQSDTEYTIRSLGWFKSLDEMRRVPVGAFNSQVVALGDVAEVKDASPEQRIFTRLNGLPAVGMIITKQQEANTVSTAKAVMERLERVKKLYPQLKFGLAYDQAQFIEASIDDVTNSALIGGVLAVLILLFFLRNIRSTLVVALSIPISIISTFALLYMCGFTINTMSLGGLALATGLIVDDAVVVLENIFRHIERDGKKPAEAAVSGTMEIASAVLASTITVVIVFLPLMLIKGQAGQMFTQFALVVIFSILVSLLDATTVVPMLASRIIKGEAHHELAKDGHKPIFYEKWFVKFGVWFDQMDASYRRGLQWCLKRRFAVIGGAVAISASSFFLVGMIGTEMLPASDSGDFTINVKMPPGTALTKTDETMRKVEKILMTNPNVATVFSVTGSTLSPRGTTQDLIPFKGGFSVKLKERGKRKLKTTEVLNELRKQFSQLAGAMAFPQQYDIVSFIMQGGPQTVEVNILGDDLTVLSRLGNEVKMKARTIAGFENVDVNWLESAPEIQWKVDRKKALQMGVTFEDIATVVGTATNGYITSYYQEGGFQYPIIVQMPEDKRKTEAELLGLTISPSVAPRQPGGGPPAPVELRQVATPFTTFGPSDITRLDRQRYIAVSGLPAGRSPGEIQAELAKLMDEVQMPQGYYWDWGVNQKRRADEYSGLTTTIILAILLIYMLLASQFESFVHPLTILVSVPLSSIGVVLGLFLTGRSFGLTAFIGLLMLVGIVVKNGILLVEYTNVLRSRGMSRDEAVLMAGPTRLRPILMTTLAAICGMLPLALEIGAGSETQSPMATAVIGGLTTSTILTLFVVPTVYTLFDDLARMARGNNKDLAPALLVEPTVESVEAK